MEKQILPLENELNSYPFPTVAASDGLTVLRCNVSARVAFGKIPAIKRVLKQAGVKGTEQLFSCRQGEDSFLVLCARWEKNGAQGPLFFFLEDPLSSVSLFESRKATDAVPRVIFPRNAAATLSPALLREAHEERLQEDKARFATFFALRKTEEKTALPLRLDTFFDSLLPLMKTLSMSCRITCAPQSYIRALPDAFCQMILYILAFFRRIESDRLTVVVRSQGDLTAVTLRATDPQGLLAGWKEIFFDRQTPSQQEQDALSFPPLLFAGLCAMRERVKMTAFSEASVVTVRLFLPSAPPQESSFFSVPTPSLCALFLDLVCPWLPSLPHADEKDKKLM